MIFKVKAGIRGLNQLIVMSEIQSSGLSEADPLVEKTGASFPLFQELLEELRLKIWKLALPGPRLIDICSDAPTPIDSHRSTPSILHVCSESRKEALKLYTALPLGYAAFRAVYVNFQIDTLYFNHYDPNGWMSDWSLAGHGLKIHQLMDNLRFLAITQDVWTHWGNDGPAMRFIQGFRKLEELTVPVFDLGTGEITDEYVSRVWDEWRIGDEVGVAIRTSECDWGYWKVIESGVMTREYGGLKNIKVRLVTVQRAGFRGLEFTRGGNTL